MRLIARLVVVCVLCLLILLVQLKLVSRQGCSQCWTSFDYDSVEPASNVTQKWTALHKHNKRLPSALIIGVKKGGTRALIDSLKLHPRIVVAKHEVHFFDNDTFFSRGLEWYRDQMQFADDDQIVVEKTPAYLTKHSCAKRVYNFNPQIKLIIILRDPVIRTISDFTQVQHSRLSKNLTLLSFQEAAFEADGKSLNFAFKPISNSLYVKHISAWLTYFPLSQLIFVDGDSFIMDPLKELRKVETFLGLEHAIDKSQIVFNVRKGFYCFRARQRQLAKCLGESKGRKHVQIDDIARRRLQQNFHVYNEQLFELISRRFNWSA